MRKLVIVTTALLVAGCKTRSHVYTCAEVLGPRPTPGYMAVFPPGWSAVMRIPFDGKPDFRVWDDHHRLVCDAQGKDVK